ncbi:hypothetical protein VTO42DRAFT_741 [Malbranchea cinnamomea]
MGPRRKKQSATVDSLLIHPVPAPPKVTSAEMPEETALPYIDLLDSDIVSLQAASSQRVFKVHQSLLAAKCPTIYVAFENGFKEATEGVYKFEDTSEETLAQFIEWAYTGDYATIACTAADQSPERKEDEQVSLQKENVTPQAHPFLEHVHLYLFGCIYLIPHLQDLAFRKLKVLALELGTPESLGAQATVITALCVSAPELAATDDRLMEWLIQYAAYYFRQLRRHPYFHQTLAENINLSMKLLQHLQKACHLPSMTDNDSERYGCSGSCSYYKDSRSLPCHRGTW